MSDDARALYQAEILKHSRAPKNEGTMHTPTHEARLDNPLCGDRVSIQLRIEDGTIREARFTGKGCAISLASASILTEAVTERPTAEASGLADQLLAFARDKAEVTDLGPLEPLRGVRSFPGRKRCATLAWEALHKALESTEE